MQQWIQLLLQQHLCIDAIYTAVVAVATGVTAGTVAAVATVLFSIDSTVAIADVPDCIAAPLIDTVVVATALLL